MSHSREQIAKDIRFVDSTPEGQRVIDYLLSFCHVLETSYLPKHGPEVTFFNEGQRSVGNEIASLLSNEPHRFKREVMERLKALEEQDD